MSISLLCIDELADLDVESLRHDCACVFNAREVASNEESYSAGHTYFSMASDEPKSGLEALALSVFRHHSADLMFDPLKSGVEWWSQVIEADSDIAFHFDRDYGLEEDEGRHVYPHTATVTYLADKGAPTLVANLAGTCDSTQSIDGITFSQLYLSFPRIGNHLSFSGDLLHAATTDVMESGADDESSEEESSTSSDDSIATAEKNAIALEKLLNDIPNRRITFLANIWIDHIPSQAEECSEQVRSLLKTSSAATFPLKLVENGKKVLSVVVDRTETGTFNHCGSNFDVNLPLPTIEKIAGEISFGDCYLLELDYASSEIKPAIVLSQDQPLSVGDEDSEQESDDEEDEESTTNKRHTQQQQRSSNFNEPKAKRQKR